MSYSPPSWRLGDERTEKDSAGFVDSKVRHRQSKEASMQWSHHQETRELHGERDNARKNARCMQARKAKHGLDGQHLDVD